MSEKLTFYKLEPGPRLNQVGQTGLRKRRETRVDHWIRDFDNIIGKAHHGLAFVDLPECEQRHIMEMKCHGFTPEEAYSVVQEVSDVE